MFAEISPKCLKVKHVKKRPGNSVSATPGNWKLWRKSKVKQEEKQPKKQKKVRTY